jgi:hypothetical protein
LGVHPNFWGYKENEPHFLHARSCTMLFFCKYYAVGEMYAHQGKKVQLLMFIDQEMDAILLIIGIVYSVCRIVIKSVQQCTYFLFSVKSDPWPLCLSHQFFVILYITCQILFFIQNWMQDYLYIVMIIKQLN